MHTYYTHWGIQHFKASMYSTTYKILSYGCLVN